MNLSLVIAVKIHSFHCSNDIHFRFFTKLLTIFFFCAFGDEFRIFKKKVTWTIRFKMRAKIAVREHL